MSIIEIFSLTTNESTQVMSSSRKNENGRIAFVRDNSKYSDIVLDWNVVDVSVEKAKKKQRYRRRFFFLSVKLFDYFSSNRRKKQQQST